MPKMQVIQQTSNASAADLPSTGIESSIVCPLMSLCIRTLYGGFRGLCQVPGPSSQKPSAVRLRSPQVPCFSFHSCMEVIGTLKHRDRGQQHPETLRSKAKATYRYKVYKHALKHRQRYHFSRLRM